MSTSWSVKVLEAKAIVDDLKHILASWDGQNPPTKVESDSIEVIKFFNREMFNLSEVFFFCWGGPVIAPFVNVTHFCKILREGNKIVHNLTALASSSGNFSFWRKFHFFVSSLMLERDWWLAVGLLFCPFYWITVSK